MDDNYCPQCMTETDEGLTDYGFCASCDYDNHLAGEYRLHDTVEEEEGWR